MNRHGPHSTSGRMHRTFLAVTALAGVAIALATFWSGPRPVAAGDDADDPEGVHIGLPAYVPDDPPANARAMYSDSSISLNTICPVRKAKIDPLRDPVYVNGRPVGFCCHPCPSIFSYDPERYLREMKVSLPCPVHPARRAILDSSLRAKINQDFFFFSSRAALKRFLRDPLRYCGKLTDPVDRVRFRPTKESPHVVFRGRDYYFADGSTLAKFQADPERYYERLAGS